MTKGLSAQSNPIASQNATVFPHKVEQTIWGNAEIFANSQADRSTVLDPAEHVAYKFKTKAKVVAIEKAPQFGHLKQLPDGTYEYKPKQGFYGRDIIKFIVLSS